MNMNQRNQLVRVIVITPLMFTLVVETPGEGLPHVPEEVHPTTPPTTVLSCGENIVTGSFQQPMTVWS